MLALTPAGSSGRLNFRVREPADYVLVVDNRADTRTAAVHLHVALDFGQAVEPAIPPITRERQLSVIVLSFLFFFGVVTYSGTEASAACPKLTRLARFDTRRALSLY